MAVITFRAIDENTGGLLLSFHDKTPKEQSRTAQQIRLEKRDLEGRGRALLPVENEIPNFLNFGVLGLIIGPAVG